MSTDRKADSAIYQAMVGRLMYAATSTRPDIAYAVAALGRYNVNTTFDDLKGRIIVSRQVAIDIRSGYRRLTRSYRLRPCWRRADRKSQGGYIFRLYGGSID